jgi:hypothetical protein
MDSDPDRLIASDLEIIEIPPEPLQEVDQLEKVVRLGNHSNHKESHISPDSDIAKTLYDHLQQQPFTDSDNSVEDPEYYPENFPWKTLNPEVIKTHTRTYCKDSDSLDLHQPIHNKSNKIERKREKRRLFRQKKRQQRSLAKKLEVEKK